MSNTPRSIRLAGRTFNLTGRGAAADSVAYLEPTTGSVLTLFRATVVRTGPSYSLCRVREGDALGPVRIDPTTVHDGARLSVGDRVLVGPVVYPDGRPNAQSAWRVSKAASRPSRPARPAAPARRTGTVVHVSRKGSTPFGRVVDARGRSYFIHASEAPGVALREGVQVSFVPVESDRGNPRAASARLT